MSREPIDLYPPMVLEIDNAYQQAIPPIGLEHLSWRTLIAIMEIAGIDKLKKNPKTKKWDYWALKQQPIDTLRTARDEYRKKYRITTPDKGQGVYNALTFRISLLEEAARHSGRNIRGSDDVESMLADIAASQHASQERT